MRHETDVKSLKIPRLRFECTACGACCTQRGGYAHVYVNDAEVGALAALLDMTPAKLRRRYTFVDELGWRQLRFRDGACTFLDPATKRCTVYCPASGANSRSISASLIPSLRSTSLR